MYPYPKSNGSTFVRLWYTYVSGQFTFRDSQSGLLAVVSAYVIHCVLDITVKKFGRRLCVSVSIVRKYRLVLVPFKKKINEWFV